jgi:hypothetical protein
LQAPAEEGPADPRTGEIEVRTSGRRTSSRIDPLGVLRRVVVFKSDEGWDVTKERAGKGAKPARPSEINTATSFRPWTLLVSLASMPSIPPCSALPVCAD